MPTTLLTAESPTDTATAVDLTYDRTVPAALVHRRSLSEVFLTDCVPAGDRGVLCAAQLPLSHGYFRDHIDLRYYDTLNVLEACRQAATCAAHLYRDVPADANFVTRAWSSTITDPDALLVGAHPGELRMLVTATDRATRGERPRQLLVRMSLELDDRTLGEVALELRWTAPDRYRALRRHARGGEPPTAFTVAPAFAGAPTHPALVHRYQPANSVLDDLRVAERSVAAILSPRTLTNRSLYDQPYDHVPALVFVEAARQCALVAVAGETAREPRITELDGQFGTFAELDGHIVIGAVADEDGTTHMIATQDGRDVARVTVRLS